MSCFWTILLSFLRGLNEDPVRVSVCFESCPEVFQFLLPLLSSGRCLLNPVLSGFVPVTLQCSVRRSNCLPLHLLWQTGYIFQSCCGVLRKFLDSGVVSVSKPATGDGPCKGWEALFSTYSMFSSSKKCIKEATLNGIPMFYISEVTQCIDFIFCFIQ